MRARDRLQTLALWLVLAAVVGLFCGAASALFLWSLELATDFRVAHEAIVYTLPLAGLLIGAIYERFGQPVKAGNDLVIDTIHDSGPELPLRMAPLVLLGTVLTHLFGGSAGREGTAVQIGASLTDWLSHRLRLDMPLRRQLLAAGVAGGFGSVFGTPIAGAVFGLEFVVLGRVEYGALVPALIAATVGDMTTRALGIVHTQYPTLTASGYAKRVPLTTYRQQRRGGRGVMGMDLKEGDYIEHLHISSTHDYLLFFTNKGKVYRIKVYELPEGSRTAKGRALINLLPLREGERVMAVKPTRDFSEGKYLVFATKDGLIKKTEFKQYDTPIRADGIIAINVRKGDELVQVRLTSGKDDIIMVSASGHAARFKETNVRPMGRGTAGVRGMNVKDKDNRVLSMDVARDEDDLFVLTENGYGKRTPMAEYPVKGRGTKGVLTAKLTSKKGHLAGALVVHEGEELVFISETGMVQRNAVSGISRMGRPTQGVRVMNLKPGDRVSAVALVVESAANGNGAAPTDASVEEDSPTAENVAEQAAAAEAAGNGEAKVTKAKPSEAKVTKSRSSRSSKAPSPGRKAATKGKAKPATSRAKTKAAASPRPKVKPKPTATAKQRAQAEKKKR
jgi:hypothetical protein